MLRVDVLVLGGGLQGLMVLDHATAAGYACLLVTRGDLGSGQTLHSHGLLNSGNGLVTGETRAELEDHVLPRLRALAVPTYGATASYLALPPPALDQLAPVWDAHDYHPERLGDADQPEGLRLPYPALRAPGHHYPKRALVGALAGEHAARIVTGEVSPARDSYHVRVAGTDQTVAVAARALVVAAGCGTARFVRDTLGVQAPALGRVGYTKTHMVCLRSPLGVLPSVGTIITPDVVIVGHVNRAHDAVGAGAEVSWYVTPAEPEPRRYDEAPDDAVAEVDAQSVARAVAALRQLVPGLAEDDDRVRATVFAGYKQDVDAQPTRPLVARVDDGRGVFVALPSVLANAWPNARHIVAQLQAAGAPMPAASALPAGMAGYTVGVVPELDERVEWRTWPAFAAVSHP